MFVTNPRRRRVRRWVASLSIAALAVGGTTGCAAVESSLLGSSAAAATTVWGASAVHEVALTLDEDEFATMVATYTDSGEKEWISADVTIDGQTFSNVGLRLKGNSSLRGVNGDADPADLPWLVDLDKFVDGQSLDGWERFVVRSNTSETALNEAVALDLLEEAGLTTQEAVATRFSVNGGDSRLRLVMQDLDDRWTEATFDGEGTLYKSEAGGDWSYRGDDAASYEDVFDVEGGTEDFAPLTEFLQWLEESTDEEFGDGLADRLDVDAFATYLAFEDLIGNFDDIDGPGNNSFLRWDAGSGRMRVVAWDHNLAFGLRNDDGGGRGGPGGGERPDPPEGFEPPTDGELPERPGGGGRGGGQGGPGGSNVLVERLLANDEYAALYEAAIERLQGGLYDDGTAQGVLDEWTALLTDEAGDLVDEDTVAEEAEQVASYFDGHGVTETQDDSAVPGGPRDG